MQMVHCNLLYCQMSAHDPLSSSAYPIITYTDHVPMYILGSSVLGIDYSEFSLLSNKGMKVGCGIGRVSLVPRPLPLREVHTVCACSNFPENTGNLDIIVYLSILFLCNRASFHCKRDP